MQNIIMISYLWLILLSFGMTEIKGSRILGVFPSPSISHQKVFSTLIGELVRRGHEVVIVSGNPKLLKEKSNENLTIIDVGPASIHLKTVYDPIQRNLNTYTKMKQIFENLSVIVNAQLYTKEVQTLLADKNKQFDLLIIEATFRLALVFTHFYKAPTILISTFGTIEYMIGWTGAALHPIYYPISLQKNINSVTLFDKINEIIIYYAIKISLRVQEIEDDKMLKARFGEDVPPLYELRKNINMVFIDMYRIWDHNRPVPPNIIYLGGLHMENKPKEDLSQDIQEYLDHSQNGVIYMSLGTNVQFSALSREIVNTFMKVFTKLPYNVLLKLDTDNLSFGLPKNVKIFKWLPQPEILRHRNIKLFITQGGMQSMSEAIISGVPMVGLPMILDQRYNVEQCVKHEIGLRLDVDSINEENVINAIKAVVNNKSYYTNIIAFRQKLHDQPQPALERALWWIEHIIRHRGSKHLQASAIHATWTEYYEVELLLVVLAGTVAGISIIVAILYLIGINIKMQIFGKKKFKTN